MEWELAQIHPAFWFVIVTAILLGSLGVIVKTAQAMLDSGRSVVKAVGAAVEIVMILREIRTDVTMIKEGFDEAVTELRNIASVVDDHGVRIARIEAHINER